MHSCPDTDIDPTLELHYPSIQLLRVLIRYGLVRELPLICSGRETTLN